MSYPILHDSIRFGGIDIPYSIRRSSERRSIGITVCGPLVEIAAPSGMRAAAIRPHVEKKGAWILQKLDLARRHAPVYPAHLQPGASIRFFGRQYQLRIFRDGIGKPRLEVRARQFNLHLSDDAAKEYAHSLVKKKFRCHLEAELPQWLNQYAAILKIAVPSFRVRELGNRWGSCSASGSLQFHWMLATQEPAFIKQVVAHELCHLIEPKHSLQFKRLLNKVYPS
jgi:predicted metal-dependent hydrolase